MYLLGINFLLLKLSLIVVFSIDVTLADSGNSQSALTLSEIERYYLDHYGKAAMSSSSSATSGLSKEKTNQCDKVNRKPQEAQQPGCGSCLPGFKEDVNKICRSECSASLNCEQKGREPCSSDTGGECGHCKLEYVQIYGKCMNESDVDNLIKRIELYLTRMEASTTHQPLSVNSENGSGKTGVSLAAKPTNQLEETGEVVEKRMPSPVSNKEGHYSDSEANLQVDKPADKAKIGVDNILFFGVVSGATLLCVVCLIIAGICWYRFYKIRKSMQPADYVGYGTIYGEKDRRGTDMTKSDSSGDRKLAQSAQMYHYQQVKQQMLALEKSGSSRHDESDVEDAEENEDGNYTVYECPGLAPAGEMEVSNPVFQGGSKGSHASTPSPPASPPQVSPTQQSDHSKP